MIDREGALHAPLVDLALVQQHAGVVHQHVQGVAAGADLLRQGAHGLQAGEVGQQELDRAVAGALLDLLAGGVAGHAIAAHQDESRSGPGQLEGCGLADAAVGAGDQAGAVLHGGAPSGGRAP